jgi:hypothetical protein
MNSYQISRQASNKLIVVEAKNNPEIIALIPAFAKGITRLDEITTEIDGLSVQQSKNITGITDDKKAQLEEVIGFTIDVAGAVHSYAIDKGDKILQAKVNYKTSRIDKMKQAEIIDAAAVVLEEAGKISAEALANEGITAEEMTQFATVYNHLKNSTGGKREAVIERTSYTDRLAELFTEAADLKKNTLDRLATQFMRKAPDFYNKYKAAANVIHRHTTKTAAPDATPGKV